jgi:hypothetical protein
MPLSAENFVHENSGKITSVGTNHVVSLAGTDSTTAGNTVVVVLSTDVGPAAPAGFVLDKQVGIYLSVYRKSEVAAGETSWTFTTVGTTLSSWYVAELSGVDPVEPLDASAGTFGGGTTANGGTRSTGTAPLNAALDTVVLAGFDAQQPGSDTQSWSAYTNGFEEVADIATAGARGLAVARKFVTGQTGTFESTATFATSGAAANTQGVLAAYRAADSPIAAPLAHIQGFGHGTHGGINSHTGADSMTAAAFSGTGGTWGTSYLIQAASARNSNYGLQIVATGAAAYVRAGSVNAPSGSAGFDVRVVSATGTVVVASITASTGTHLAELLYDTSTSQFGIRCGTTGTVSWQSGTTALNTWVWVDIRWKTNTSTWHAEWRLETGTDTYTEQSAADLAGQATTNYYMVELGRSSAQTMTADYANVCLSRYYVAYPLTPHQIRLLTVDPAGTPTLSGTSTNFSVFTANGTLGAWNAVNARNAVDEVPPDVSATADGVCQTAVAASDYIEFPMAAPTVAADEVIGGVRMLAAMWGGTGTGTGTVGIRGWDGTTETILVAASTSYDAGSPTVISSTEPRWECAMWQIPSGGWTATLLAAAALRFGFSTDATPDMGTDALYLEYAVRKAVAQGVFGTVGDVVVASQTNPNTLGIRSIATTTPAEHGTDVTWEVSGTPTTVSVPASGTDSQTLDAADAPTINRIDLHPDPEPTPPS